MSHLSHDIHVCTECDRFWICKKPDCTEHVETICSLHYEQTIPAPKARLIIPNNPISKCEWI